MFFCLFVFNTHWIWYPIVFRFSLFLLGSHLFILSGLPIRRVVYLLLLSKTFFFFFGLFLLLVFLLWCACFWNEVFVGFLKILLGVCWTSWRCRLVFFNKFGEFSVIFLRIFCPPFLSDTPALRTKHLVAGWTLAWSLLSLHFLGWNHSLFHEPEW